MGNSLLIGLPRTQIKRSSAARVIITVSKKSSHITPILQELHWLPVSCRIVYKLLLFVFKSLNDSAPAYIDDLLKPYNPPRKLRSDNLNLLIEPKSNRSWGWSVFFSCRTASMESIAIIYQIIGFSHSI